MAEQEFKPEMRLTCQCSIPVHTDEDAKAEYLSLKKYLLAISPNIKLNGQVMMPLEPCCDKPKQPAAGQPGFTHFTPANPKGEKIT